MENKLPESSQPGKLTRLSAADIRKRPLTSKDKSILANIAAEQAREDSIAGISEERITAGRPTAKELVGVRLDPDVLAWLRSYGDGYSARINSILRSAMKSGG